jgi:hypothetical protein
VDNFIVDDLCGFGWDNIYKQQEKKEKTNWDVAPIHPLQEFG